MTLNRILRLAARYLIGHLRRYLFLLVAVSFGFAIITTMTALSDGMSENVTRAAREHYSGDLFIMGFDADNGQAHRVANSMSISRAVEKAGLTDMLQIKRTNVFRDGVLYFAGNSSRQKNVYGVDWINEKQALSGLDFTDGTYSENPVVNAILISRPVAESLNARVGDDLTLQVETLTGQKNTATVIITGIFNDPSIFGYYKSFMDRRTLNNLIGMDPDDYSALGFFLPKQMKIADVAERLQSALSKQVLTAPLISSKAMLNTQRRESWKGIRHFVVPLYVYISEVDELLTAMDIVSYVVFLMITLIILVSIAFTYKLVINERTQEIGTLRAVGMMKGTLQAILMAEAAYLFIASLVCGLMLSLILLGSVSLISFDWIPGFEIFTRSGKLVGVLRFRTILINASILIAIVLPAALFPAVRASNITLTKALNSD